MTRVESLRARIILQFLAVLAPVAFVLIGQTWFDQQRASIIQHSLQVRQLSLEAQAAYRWVIDRSLRFPGKLAAGGHHLRTCSINLSGSSLTDENLLRYIQGKLIEYGVQPRLICFEITETATIANMNRALRLISELRARGCRFALDDFGTGLASFAYLKNLPVDFLKIDGTFIRDVVGDPVNTAIVKAINEIGHALGIRTIAEYVEGSETLQALRNLGVDYGQGYGIARPRPLENFA